MLSHSDLAGIFHRLAAELEKIEGEPVKPSKPTIDLNTTLGIQQAFNAVRAGDYPKLKEDGVHGPVTVFAIKEFQATVGIPVTGMADEITVGAFHKSIFGA